MNHAYRVAAELVTATIDYHRARMAQLAADNAETDRAARDAYYDLCSVQNELNQLCTGLACE